MASSVLAIKPPPLHRAQREALSMKPRFLVWVAGRRLGKSKAGAAWLLDGCMGQGPGTVCWWNAPTFAIAHFGWRELVRLCRQIPGTQIWSPDRATVNSRIELPSGPVIEVRSADNPDSLRGEGLTRAVIDEAGMVPPSAWSEALYPALGDRHGRALLISTPKGPNWFAEAYQRGQDPDELHYGSVRHPSSCNPFLDPEIIRQAEHDSPRLVFEQEWLAEFVSDGAVFRNIDECVTDAPDRAGVVVVGVDWGKQSDFSVFVAIDQVTGHVLDFDRMNQVDYTIQIDRLAQFVARNGAVSVLAEHNGIGQVLCDLCDQAGIPTHRFETTNASKARIVGALVSAFDHKQIRIPKHEVLRTELQAFTMTTATGGTIRYSAPEGMHDDCVMALALAWEARCVPTTVMEWV